MPEKIIKVNHLAKHFGKIRAVEDLSFEVFKGDIFGVLGPNGAQVKRQSQTTKSQRKASFWLILRIINLTRD